MPKRMLLAVVVGGSATALANPSLSPDVDSTRVAAPDVDSTNAGAPDMDSTGAPSGALGEVIAAAPPPALQPLVLASGAPACGNVMLKSYNPAEREDPVCPVVRNLRDLEQTGRSFQAQVALHQLGAPASRRGSAT